MDPQKGNRVSKVLNVNKANPGSNLYFPFWRLGQHSSRFDLASATQNILSNGISYINSGKEFVVENIDGKTRIKLEVIGSNEYLKPREANEPWPHLLISQDFTTPGNPSINLSKYKHLNFSLDVRISKSINKMSSSEYNSGLHCAQTTAYFIVKDKNNLDYIWFGIPIYDSRFTYQPGTIMVDKGGGEGHTGKLIYVPRGQDILSQDMSKGEWEHIRLDLLPYIKTALTAAQQRKFLVGTSFEDLIITHFNLGWEVTGTFDCAMEIEGLSLKGE